MAQIRPARDSDGDNAIDASLPAFIVTSRSSSDKVHLVSHIQSEHLSAISVKGRESDLGVIAGDVADDTKIAYPDMATVPGYSNMRFDESLVSPPPLFFHRAEESQQQEFTRVPVITEATARQALLDYVQSQCCWGKGAANNLELKRLTSKTCYHYILESFTEARSTKWENVPFKDQKIDGPQNGVAPGPWDIVSNPLDLFQDEIRKMEVPHTASVKPCHRCRATGYLICSSCGGNKICGSCHLRGRQSKRVHTKDGYTPVTRSSRSCVDQEQKRCFRCSGTGRVICGTCDGSTNVKWFIQLTITWKNILGHHITEKSGLPEALIYEAAGALGFQDTQTRVLPIALFPEPDVNAASRRLVAEHNLRDKRVLMQRHVIRMVPVTVCYYTHKDKSLTYFVYGLECKVHAPTYPDQCCWGCSIL